MFERAKLREGYLMNCKNCGEPLSENSKFCATCGTPVQNVPVVTTEAVQSPVPAAVEPVFVPAAPSQIVSPSAPPPVIMNAPPAAGPAPASDRKKKSRGKPILIALISVVILAVAAAGIYIIIGRLSGTGSGGAYPQMTPLLIISGEDEVQVYSGDKKPVTVDGLMSSTKYSMDGKKVALTVDADDAGLADLWYCDGKKAVSVDDSVYSFTLSDSGSKIAYLKDYDYETQSGNLYVYDVQTKKSTEVVQEAYPAYTLSPDGKSVAYAADVSVDDYGVVDSFKGYVTVNGGKAQELGENQFAFALTDNGTYIYYIEVSIDSPDTGVLYIRHGKADDKLGSADLQNSIYFNKDYTEMMFVKSGSTYICVDGKDKVKVSGSALQTVYTPAAAQYTWNGFMYMYTVTRNISSLSDQLLTVTDTDTNTTSLSYLKKDLKAEDIDELSTDFYPDVTLSVDGKALRYINDSGKILYYKSYRDLKTDPEKIDSDQDVLNFIVMPDESTVYYIDTDQTLWAQRGKSAAEEIASDVETYSLCASNDGKGIYYIADFTEADEGLGGGVLNYVKNAAKAKSVEIADGVYSVAVSKYGTVYYVYDHTGDDTYSYFGEAFFSQNDKDFKSIMDNAEIS